MAPGWVPTARVVVLPSHALEGRRLVDGHTRASILVLVARVRVVNSRDLRRKAVRASYVHGRDQRQQKNFWVDARRAGGPRRSEAVSDPAGESERTVDPDSESMSTTGETERATFLIGSLWAVVVECRWKQTSQIWGTSAAANRAIGDLEFWRYKGLFLSCSKIVIKIGRALDSIKKKIYQARGHVVWWPSSPTLLRRRSRRATSSRLIFSPKLAGSRAS